MFPRKPLLDESAFQQLLSAAYVLQEYNDRVRAQELGEKPAAAAPPSDYSQTLAQIVETQNLIQARHLDMPSVLSLIAERSQKFTGASAASVSMLIGDQLVCKAAAGRAEKNAVMAASASLSATCLKTGQLLQCTDTASDSRVPADACREQQVLSLIAVPVFQDARIAGMLELRFAQTSAFEEHGVRTCQLMAGLVTEALNRAAELEWKQVLASERATMLEVLEKLKPQLERLAVQSPAPPEPPVEIPFIAPEPEPEPQPTAMEAIAAEREKTACRGCSNELAEDEAYCGICGAPHPLNQAAGRDIQSKWASMWHMRQAAEKKEAAVAEALPSAMPSDSVETLAPALQEIAARFEAQEGANALALPGPQPEEVSLVPAPAALPADPATWNSARNARKWLESLKSSPSLPGWLGRLWRNHRANIYLLVSAVLLGLVLAGWGGEAATGASAQSRWARHHPQPQLTSFEKVLVALNLAVPPPNPTYHGNPDARVWVDTHTALYYCQGSELYGKTPGGKFSSQREAQIDQFEPDSRRVCD
jgi:putative methionine-R-sulfoxide reductase with GAF domain